MKMKKLLSAAAAGAVGIASLSVSALAADITRNPAKYPDTHVYTYKASLGTTPFAFDSGDQIKVTLGYSGKYLLDDINNGVTLPAGVFATVDAIRIKGVEATNIDGDGKAGVAVNASHMSSGATYKTEEGKAREIVQNGTFVKGNITSVDIEVDIKAEANSKLADVTTDDEINGTYEFTAEELARIANVCSASKFTVEYVGAKDTDSKGEPVGKDGSWAFPSTSVSGGTHSSRTGGARELAFGLTDAYGRYTYDMNAKIASAESINMKIVLKEGATLKAPVTAYIYGSQQPDWDGDRRFILGSYVSATDKTGVIDINLNKDVFYNANYGVAIKSLLIDGTHSDAYHPNAWLDSVDHIELDFIQPLAGGGSTVAPGDDAEEPDDVPSDDVTPDDEPTDDGDEPTDDGDEPTDDGDEPVDDGDEPTDDGDEPTDDEPDADVPDDVVGGGNDDANGDNAGTNAGDNAGVGVNDGNDVIQDGNGNEQDDIFQEAFGSSSADEVGTGTGADATIDDANAGAQAPAAGNAGAAEANPGTGIALALVPAAIAGAAVVIAKKKKH